MPPFQQIKQQVSGKKQKTDLFYWADIFMNEYGMNFEDFKSLNIPAFYLLRDKIQKRYLEQEKSLKKKGRR